MNQRHSPPSVVKLILVVLSGVVVVSAMAYFLAPVEARYELRLETARLIERTARRAGWRDMQRQAFRWRNRVFYESLDHAVLDGEVTKLTFSTPRQFGMKNFIAAMGSFASTNHYRLRSLRVFEYRIDVWVENRDVPPVRKYIDDEFPGLTLQVSDKN